MPKLPKAITEGDKIFKQISRKTEWTATTSILEANRLLKQLIKATDGLVIVDFLDSGNWDYIDGIEIDKKRQLLKLIWRDYRNVSENDEDKMIRAVAFPGALYALFLKFNELRKLEINGNTFFLLRGFALKDKELAEYLKVDSSEFQIQDNNDNFSKLVLRRIKDIAEVYTCLNTPIFSVIILPKNSTFSSLTSKKVLLQYNIFDSIKRLDSVSKILEDVDLVDIDIICEKSNTVRRIMEYSLKVELCYRFRQLNVKKDYSDLMLGDLIKLIKPYRSEAENTILKHVVVLSNELSHDTGKKILRKKALCLAYLATCYLRLLKYDVMLRSFPEEQGINDDEDSDD
ncbi:MAG: hypothetical protein V4557_12615 [Bacteroidota bacterium]